jgi:hypothetical protein
MTGKQAAVMWLGLILIMLRLFTTDQWHEVWGTLTTKTTSSNANPGVSDASVTTHPNISNNGAKPPVMKDGDENEV